MGRGEGSHKYCIIQSLLSAYSVRTVVTEVVASNPQRDHFPVSVDVDALEKTKMYTHTHTHKHIITFA